MGTLPESVPGGKIMRHPDNDTPTGVFLDNAMGLVDFVRPQWTEKQMKMYLDRTVGDAVAKGVTGIHDAFGLPEHIEFYQRFVGVALATEVFKRSWKLIRGLFLIGTQDGR